jgi:hypothetical protein
MLDNWNTDTNFRTEQIKTSANIGIAASVAGRWNFGCSSLSAAVSADGILLGF